MNLIFFTKLLQKKLVCSSAVWLICFQPQCRSKQLLSWCFLPGVAVRVTQLGWWTDLGLERCLFLSQLDQLVYTVRHTAVRTFILAQCRGGMLATWDYLCIAVKWHGHSLALLILLDLPQKRLPCKWLSQNTSEVPGYCCPLSYRPLSSDHGIWL